MELKGTKELKDLLALILKGVDVGVRAQADGKIDVTDLGLLLALIPLVGPAVDQIGEIPGELADLSAAESAEVVAYIMASLTLGEGKAREVINASLSAASAVYKLVKAVQAPAAA